MCAVLTSGFWTDYLPVSLISFSASSRSPSASRTRPSAWLGSGSVHASTILVLCYNNKHCSAKRLPLLWYLKNTSNK